MRKKILVVMAIIFSVLAMGATRLENIGIIYEDDFRSVGVSEENIAKAKDIILEANRRHQILMLERKQLELEVNKYMLEGSEENWDKISNVFDKLGQVEAELMKNKLRSQVEIRNYISEEEYLRARGAAVKRLEASQNTASEGVNISDKK
ncbi:hypothetical protein PM10SUCC1_15700 [Propionigenium maris DSM 9537]|uniref:Uncharacterized protein n=1 Tax=Propionigenium maris DSM 9537 TaxID=1123000 RepID=A0A9W6LM80_9FUSO|nr:hypothetical protein [Propionigenium maris]GLI56056.1 hypothetical protein PM10SUCC1_15700 [Propionigenium maris DSM 9537]